MNSRDTKAAGSSATAQVVSRDPPPPIVVSVRAVDGSEPRPQRHVSFTTDTIDNEHLNKKSSKICCIFHPKEGHTCPPSDDPAELPNAYERQ
jgi:protein phosphatase 1 regulatory subunit 11